MNARAALPFAGAALAFALVWALWPKEKTTPEAAVRALIARAVDAAERKDPAGVMDTLSGTFTGSGGTSRDEVKGLVVGQLLRGTAPRVLNPRLEVTAQPDGTVAWNGTFVFLRAGEGEAQGSRYELDGVAANEDGHWRITRAGWRQP